MMLTVVKFVRSKWRLYGEYSGVYVDETRVDSVPMFAQLNLG